MDQACNNYKYWLTRLSQVQFTFKTMSYPSLVSRPHPAFRRLQYGKAAFCLRAGRGWDEARVTLRTLFISFTKSVAIAQAHACT